MFRPLSKTIIKAIGVFSGVKMISILCSIIRNKLIAVLIGPAGVGLIALYNSVIDVVGAATRLSIDQSAVRDISRDSTPEHAATIATVVRRWSLWLGIMGMVLMCALSPLLSLWMFEYTGHWWAFCLLSVVPLATAMTAGRTSIMTGLNKLGDLARSSAYAAVIAVILSVALIWLLGEWAIVPMIIIYAVTTLVMAMVFSPRLERVKLTVKQIVKQGAGFIRLGILMTASSFITLLFSYIFYIYLNSTASTDNVGIYQAGYTLVNTYVGIIFTGIWVEYYPRLSRAVHSRRSTSAIVSHEIGIALCVLLPVVLAFICADSLIVNILYDHKFLAGVPYISIGVIGVILRAFSWCVAFVIVARGDGTIYIVVESISAILGLVFNVIGWSLGGMAGLGIAYIVYYLAYSIIVMVVYRRRYKLQMPRRLIAYTALTILIAAVALTAKIFIGWWVVAIILALSIYPCLKALRN